MDEEHYLYIVFIKGYKRVFGHHVSKLLFRQQPDAHDCVFTGLEDLIFRGNTNML